MFQRRGLVDSPPHAPANQRPRLLGQWSIRRAGFPSSKRSYPCLSQADDGSLSDRPCHTAVAPLFLATPFARLWGIAPRSPPPSLIANVRKLKRPANRAVTAQ